MVMEQTVQTCVFRCIMKEHVILFGMPVFLFLRHV